MLAPEQYDDAYFQRLERAVERLDNATFMQTVRMDMMATLPDFHTTKENSGKNSLNWDSSPVYISKKRKKLYTQRTSPIISLRQKKRQPTLSDLFAHDLTEKQLDKYLLFLGEAYPPKNWERSPPVASSYPDIPLPEFDNTTEREFTNE